METALNRVKQVTRSIVVDENLYNRFSYLGLIPDQVRKNHVGKSDYSQHTIQPWSIWLDYNLNAWDADIVKRVLRTKKEANLSKEASRILDYEKIIHICKERIRQLRNHCDIDNQGCIALDIDDLEFPTKTLYGVNLPDGNSYMFTEEQQSKYVAFINKHKDCGKQITTEVKYDSGIGTEIKIKCLGCHEEEVMSDVILG